MTALLLMTQDGRDAILEWVCGKQEECDCDGIHIYSTRCRLEHVWVTVNALLLRNFK